MNTLLRLLRPLSITVRQRTTVIGILTILIFALDISTPSAINPSLFYILPVSFALWLPWRYSVATAAAVCIVLTYLDYLVSGQSIQPWPDFLNHLFSVLAIAGVALLDTMLANSRNQLNTVLDTAAEGIITINTRGIIESFNRMAEEIFGYSAAEAIGRNINLLMASPEREQHDGYLARYLDSGAAHIIGKRREVNGCRKDGSLFPLEIAIAESYVGSRRIFTGVIRDISSRKANQQALLQSNHDLKRRTEELSQANEELSQFAHVVSHDLKAPLRAIANYSTWLAEDLDATVLNEDQREYLQGMLEAVKQAETLIEELLEFSRIGRQDVFNERLALTAFFTQLVNTLELGSNVSVQIQPGMPAISSAPLLLRQIFQNLILNAVKYNNSAEKTVAITASPQADGAVEISVRDNGIGIDPRFHERIFQIFQRLHTREEYDGTGIGLAIVKKAAQQLGCQIRVESEVGCGSNFILTLPPTVSLKTA